MFAAKLLHIFDISNFIDMIYDKKIRWKSHVSVYLSIFNLVINANTEFLNKNIVEKILKYGQITLILHSQRDTYNGEY